MWICSTSYQVEFLAVLFGHVSCSDASVLFVNQRLGLFQRIQRWSKCPALQIIPDRENAEPNPTTCLVCFVIGWF